MLRVLEYLEQAIEEAEAVALEYTERSPCAAVASSDETDEAEVSISKLPDAYPQFDHGTRRYLLRRVPFSLVYRVEQTRIVIVLSLTVVDGPAIGTSLISQQIMSRCLQALR